MKRFILRNWLSMSGRFNLQAQHGASMVEYILLVVFIAIIALVAVKLLGTNLSKKFSSAAASLN